MKKDLLVTLTVRFLTGLAVVLGVVLFILSYMRLDIQKSLEVYTPKNIYYIDLEKKIITNEVGEDTIHYKTANELETILSDLTAKDVTNEN